MKKLSSQPTYRRLTSDASAPEADQGSSSVQEELQPSLRLTTTFNRTHQTYNVLKKPIFRLIATAFFIASIVFTCKFYEGRVISHLVRRLYLSLLVPL